MNGVTRYFIVGRSRKGKMRTLFSTSKETEAREYVSTIFNGYMFAYYDRHAATEAFSRDHKDSYIVDWQDRKQVSLLQYAKEQNII